MAWVNTTPKWSGRVSESDADRKAITDGYEVLFDSPSDNQESAVNAPGIPVDGTPYSGDPSAELTGRRAKPIGPLFWEVTCVYTRAGGGGVTNPLLKPAQINYSQVPSDESIDVDIAGNPILNRAHQPFENYATRQISDQMIIIQRNKEEAAISYAFLEEFKDSVNSATFLGAPPGTGKMRALSATYVQQIVGGLAYWDVQAQIQFRTPPTMPLWLPDNTIVPANTNAVAWYIRRANMGMDEYWPTVQGDPPTVNPFPWRRIHGPNGEPVSRPVPLQANGKAMPAPSNPINPMPVIWLGWKVYKDRDFNAIGLLT